MNDTAYTVWDLIPALATKRPAMRKCSYVGIFTGRAGAERWVDPSRDSVIVPMHKDRAWDWGQKALPADEFDTLRKRYEVTE